MAREGTKAHQLSLQSGELPMASSAAIACIADALRQLRSAAAATTPRATPPAASAPLSRGLQFAVADVEWWRSPWPTHPILQGVMHRLPPREARAVDDEADDESAQHSAARGARRGKADGARRPSTDGPPSGSSAMDQGARVEAFLQSRLSVWQPSLSLTELGLDSLDLVQLRNGFQKAFKRTVPLATFTNAQQTLEQLLSKLSGGGS